MAKDAKDKSEDTPAVFTPATQSDLRSMLDEYDAINADKNEKADAQKLLLEKFNQKHSLPPWIAKILRKLDKLDDADQAHAWRALTHAGDVLGFNRQRDLEDYAASKASDPGDDGDDEEDEPDDDLEDDGDGDEPEVQSKAPPVSDEEWDNAAPGAAN